MRTPKENPVGYNSFNPNVLAKNLKGNLLLLHGTSDDNVHFQHSIQLINALNAANKTYQLYIFPDAEHGTTGKKMRYDLYNKIYLFLREKL
jgi:dipeptidyl-peptidase-4